MRARVVLLYLAKVLLELSEFVGVSGERGVRFAVFRSKFHKSNIIIGYLNSIRLHYNQ